MSLIGFISCGSTSSSKPTTPIPTNHNSSLADKNSDDGGEYECCSHSNGENKNHDVNDNKAAVDDDDDEIISTSDNESGVEFTRDCLEEGENSKSNTWLPSTSSTSSKGGIKSRSKHRNLSLFDQSSTHTTRYRKKHISLDDEIVIYESDSSLVESRRRFSNSKINNYHQLQQPFIMYSRLSSDNQVRASVAISRHKSEENPSSLIHQPSNQIVSILKRKDSAGTSTGNQGNQSPSLVTFSPNVKDAETSATARNAHRQGILKKRSSLDESSRRYRSHSPSSAASSESERGCLRKSKSYRRRNSCEEIHHQGILKQKSYESTGYSSSGASGVNTPNSITGVQGILKKPSLTPSDHFNDHVTTKHVSISEAVILAAAELCKDMVIDDSHEPYYIKPILKLDNDHHNSHEARPPKPILKKHSSESEEIRSILKSRKSSREEDS